MTQINPDKSQKYALISGAAGGIGQCMAVAFGARGYRVLATDHVPRPAGLVCWHYLQVDLGQLVSDGAYAAETLTNISGLLADARLDVNLIAPFVLTQGLLPQLEAAGGCVINISSIHARLTKANFVAYATSKAALSGMTCAMAVDLGGQVRVNAIEPAAIATEMLKAGFAGEPEQYARLESCHPQGRIGTPEEVSALALAMTEGELRFMHGAMYSHGRGD